MTKNIKLFNGYDMPNLGLGSWLSKPGEVKTSTKIALNLGYRHLDCAWAYLNEKEIGDALEEAFNGGKFQRNDVFVTSKLWNSFHRPENVPLGFNETLTNLKLEYLDLYLIHWPLATKYGNLFPSADIYKDEIDDVDLLDTWRAMEKLVDSGKVRSIGVSNFNIKQVQYILDNCRIRPAVNQIEVHIYLPNKKLVEFCLKNDIQVMAYSPLGGAFDRPTAEEEDHRPLEDPEVLRIAQNHNATAGQILISYILTRGLICIPKSASPERLKQNIEAASIKLSDEEFNILDNRDISQRMCDPKIFRIDKNYPFWED